MQILSGLVLIDLDGSRRLLIHESFVEVQEEVTEPPFRDTNMVRCRRMSLHGVFDLLRWHMTKMDDELVGPGCKRCGVGPLELCEDCLEAVRASGAVAVDAEGMSQ